MNQEKNLDRIIPVELLLTALSAAALLDLEYCLTSMTMDSVNELRERE
jgi:uncharacterized OsmC-like protein